MGIGTLRRHYEKSEVPAKSNEAEKTEKAEDAGKAEKTKGKGAK